MSLVLAALKKLVLRRDLSVAESEAVFESVMEGTVAEVELAAFLSALRTKGETADELEGLARRMRARLTPIPTTRAPLLDTCGTGGDELHTFNISTATALVVAGCGVAVAKHGNRSVSSASGSADVLEHLGVHVGLTADQVGRCLDDTGLGFCFAPLLHGAMKHAAPVRKALGIRTIFNLAGPLTNPARAEYQLVGTYRVETAETLAKVLLSLGTKRAVVVCGADQLDEVSLWGETTAFIVEETSIRRETWTAADFGLEPCAVEELRVHSPAESAALIRRVLSDEPCAGRDIVLANSAAALLALGRVASLKEGVAQAGESVTSGAAAKALERLSRRSQELAAG
jgi:anthranilate phosphoribosyltransferase